MTARQWPETKPRKKDEPSFVAAQVEQARVQREIDDDRLEAGLLPDVPPAEMPAYEVKRLELEKAALLEALRLPEQPEPEKTSVALMVRPTLPVVSDVQIEQANISVADAVREQDAALAAVEDSKKRLEAANTALNVARQDATITKHTQAKAVAQAKLLPLIERVTGQRRALQSIHDHHNAALTAYAKSCASGDLQERNLLQVIYSEAAPLKLKLALAYKKAEEALRFLGSAHISGPESLQWSVSNAEQSAATALAFSPTRLRSEIEALIARYAAVRGPKLPTGPRLGPAEQATGNVGVLTDGWHPHS